MARTLILYQSGYGHTRRIAERLGRRLEEGGEQVELLSLDDPAVDLEQYGRVIIGASIRNGKHKPEVIDFIERNLALLESRAGGFFSVNLVARKPGKNTPETNPYLVKFLENCPWTPDLVGVFAGNLDYSRYRFFDRHIIRFIMWLTKGPTDLDTKVEYTDWDEVDRFAGRIAALESGRANPRELPSASLPPLAGQGRDGGGARAVSPPRPCSASRAGKG